MKLNLILLLLFTIVALGITTYLNHFSRPQILSVPQPTDQEITNFPPAPTFSFTTLDQKSYEITEFKGKIIILNFWASWCAPCVVEFPKLLELASQEPENIILIAISVDADKQNIDTFFNKMGADFQKNIHQKNVLIGWDPNKAISQDLFQTILYPETYIIGRDLTLRRKIVGADTDFSSEAFRKNLLKELH